VIAYCAYYDDYDEIYDYDVIAYCVAVDAFQKKT
jgi:hypothetical protein